MQERGGWNSIYLENHDEARSVSRFGDVSTPEFRSTTAKLLAAMQCTLSGTLYVYQGEEIAMANVPTDWPIEEYKDVASQTYFYEELAARRTNYDVADPDMSDIWDGLRRKARDHARSPMQWDNSRNAGFSLVNNGDNGAKPWMRVHDDHKEWNVAKQSADPNSVLAFWKAMLSFRKRHLSCTYGIYAELSPEDERIYAYTKDYEAERTIVLLNFTKDQLSYPLPPQVGSIGPVTAFIDNYPGELPDVTKQQVDLRPYEALVIVTTR